LRVTHPKYRDEVRDVQLISKQSTEIHVQLKSNGSLGNTVRNLFRH
jgi:hypothetical protein